MQRTSCECPAVEQTEAAVRAANWWRHGPAGSDHCIKHRQLMTSRSRPGVTIDDVIDDVRVVTLGRALTFPNLIVQS